MATDTSRYIELLARVESLFEHIRSRHLDAMKCRLGCHSCCKPGLTVGLLEAARIREALALDPARSAGLLANERLDPFKGKRCAFLSPDGACGIYELRPLVCRSHGVPLQFKDPSRPNDDNAQRFRDVCGLNFTGADLGALPASDVMNLDTLNTLLALLTRLAFGDRDERVELKPSALVGEVT